MMCQALFSSTNKLSHTCHLLILSIQRLVVVKTQFLKMLQLAQGKMEQANMYLMKQMNFDLILHSSGNNFLNQNVLPLFIFSTITYAVGTLVRQFQ